VVLAAAVVLASNSSINLLLDYKQWKGGGLMLRNILNQELASVDTDALKSFAPSLDIITGCGFGGGCGSCK